MSAQVYLSNFSRNLTVYEVLTASSKAELLVDLLVRTRCTPAKQAELLRKDDNQHSSSQNSPISLPRGCTSAIRKATEHASSPISLRSIPPNVHRTYRECLHRKNRCAAPEHTQPVLLRLEVEDRPARKADHAGLDALSLELHGCLQRDADFTARADDREVLALLFEYDVATLRCTLNRGGLEVRQVLPRQRQDRRCLLTRERDVVRGRGLVAVCRTPEVDVGHRAEVRGRLDRLVRWAVLTETNRVVGGYVTRIEAALEKGR